MIDAVGGAVFQCEPIEPRDIEPVRRRPAPDGQRNVLRIMFRDSRVRAVQSNWESVARYVVASFRADVARAGAARNVQSLVDELCATSPEFAAMWRDNDVQGHCDGVKVLHHPVAGKLSMEFSGFAVDGRPDLTMVIYNPVTEADAGKIRALLVSPPKRKAAG